ncbi:hypothetical protein, partial [Streptomyces sp. NPDC004976]
YTLTRDGDWRVDYEATTDRPAFDPPSFPPLHPLSSRPLAAVSATSIPTGRRVLCHLIVPAPSVG